MTESAYRDYLDGDESVAVVDIFVLGADEAALDAFWMAESRRATEARRTAQASARAQAA